MKRLFALFLLLLLLQGCGGTTPSRPDPAPQLPQWVLQPEKPGYVSAVGAAMPQEFGGLEAQRRVAILKARKVLAETVRVRVTASFESRAENRNGQVTQEHFMQTELRSKVLLSLNQAQIIKEWQDPVDGMLYIWLAVPENILGS